MTNSFRKSLADSLLQSIITKIRAKGSTKELPTVGGNQVIESFNIPTNQYPSNYKNVNDEGIVLLRKWAEAVVHEDKLNEEVYHNKLSKLTFEHPFPWLETKKLFLEAFVKPDYWKYLDWRKSDKKMNFGVINYTLPASAKLAVIGDWGTGTPDAQSLLDNLFDTVIPDAILHTGDIYFACTSVEIQENFITPLENIFTKIGKRIPVFSVPGNHDYYSGGKGFYEMLEVINAPLGKAYLQEASYFCLRTADSRWQILGGDTGINDRSSFQKIVSNPGLRPSELDWMKDKLNFAGKTMLVTHHPLVDDELFISKDPHAHGKLKHFNDNLLGQFGEFFPKIDFWLWGHNHKFAAYRKGFPIPFTQLQLPRCRLIGSSAREVETIHIRYRDIIVSDENECPIAPNRLNGLYNHSYAIIDLGSKKASYYQVPAWDERNPAHQTTLPSTQKKCFFEEALE